MSHFADLGSVVLGGELPQFWDWLSGPVDALQAARRQANPQFCPEINQARFGVHAPERGAWLTFRDAVLDDPTLIPVVGSPGPTGSARTGAPAGDRVSGPSRPAVDGLPSP